MKVEAQHIVQAHELYCHLTGQKLRLDYLRQRQWYELLHQGFTFNEIRRVILYLQREIREGRRNVGALKLSNLLQPDRFEEDLNIRRIRLEAPGPSVPPPPPLSKLSSEEKEQRRIQALNVLKQFKQSLS
jgi:hypothetical protein